MDRNHMVQQIQALSDRDAAIIQNTLRALDSMKQNKYPFLGNFLDIIEETSEEPDVFVCSMPITRELLNPYRIVYGGITATLADMAMAWMLEGRLGNEEKFVTIDMHVNYHKAGTGKRLIAKARVLNQAQEIWQVCCEINNDKGDLVSTSTATFLQLRRNRP